MTRKLTPEEKVERYQTIIRQEDLVMAVTDIQYNCNFKPKLSTRGNINSLKNTIRLIAYSLHPDDSKVFHPLTNWVLHRMEVTGWTNAKYLKPTEETILDLKVASKVYTKEVLPKYKLNNYEYDYDNVFKHSDADDLAWVVNYMMIKEKGSTMLHNIPEDKASIYGITYKAMKYIQLWCQLNYFDIRKGIDLREKNNKKSMVDSPYLRLEEIEREVYGGSRRNS